METIIELFEESIRKYPNNVYLYEKTTGEYKGYTYSEVKETVIKVASGLVSIGIAPGDRVALLSEGRTAWIIGELAILYTGACCVPLSIKLDAGTDLKFRLQHSGSRMVMVSAQQASKIEEIRDSLPELESVIYIDGSAIDSDKDYTYQGLINLGENISRETSEELLKRVINIKPDDLANISYTSGTTADPKGIMLTHKNYIANVKQALTLMNIPPTHRTLAILPWDHSFAHTACLYCFMAMGASVGSIQNGKSGMETLKNIPLNIKELKPHIIMSVPALSRNFKKNIESAIDRKGKVAKSLFRIALSVAYQYNGLGFDRGMGTRATLKPLVILFDKLLFRKIREGFGGELEFFIGGGALLDVDLQRFFYAIGIPVCQGYGLTEASPIISSNSLAHIKIGTSGKLVKYLDLKICDINGDEVAREVSGEIVIRGDNVMKGYWKNEKATSEMIRDGWLYTGDLGYMDKDDYLVVLGRFKSLLIGNDGEKYSPEAIEEAIAYQSTYISQCILHNNQQPLTVGLIVPAIGAINSQLEHSGLKPGTPEAIDAGLTLIQHEIASYYKHGKHSGMFPERWLPSAICVLPEGFTEQNYFMNSTLKIVRVKIMQHYQNEIDFLYKPEAKNILNQVNRKNLAKWYT